MFKEKWQQKSLSSLLKEIEKQCIEVNYKIFTSEDILTKINELSAILDLLTMFWRRHKMDKLFKATPKYLPTIKSCLKPFQLVVKSERGFGHILIIIVS